MRVDTSTEFGARVMRRLQSDGLGWLTSVRPNGTPHTHQVWFWWNGSSFLMFSRPELERLVNIRSNPNVTLHLDSDGDGRNIVVLAGTAEILDEDAPGDEVEAYLKKYARWIARLDWTRESFLGLYSVPYRVTPSAVTGM